MHRDPTDQNHYYILQYYIGFRYQIGYLDSFSNLDATCSLLILVATCTCKYSELLLLIGRSGEDIAIFSTLANTVLLGNMSWDTDLRYFRIADRRRDTFCGHSWIYKGGANFELIEIFSTIRS